MSDNNDNLGLVASSDYVLNQLTIVTSSGQTIDVQNIMLELDLYEDIFAPTMSGSIRLGDAADIISSLSLHGNEFLLLNIDKPTLNKPIIKTFRIYKISNREFGTASLQNYTLWFCSEELLLSSQTTVGKSYKGIRIDQMVNDILMNKLKTDPSKVSIFTQTAGNFDLIIPRMQPFQAIEWLLPKSYNNNQNLFLFFENRDGYNFTSFENLISLPTYQTYSRSVKTTSEPEENINSVNYIKVVEDFNMLKAMRSGEFSSSLLIFDVVNRRYNSFNFNATSLANNATLNGNLPANEMQNRLGQSVYTVNENLVKFIISKDGDPTTNPALIHQWLPQTAARLAQLQSFKVVITIPGDILIKAGAVVGLIIQKMQTQTKVAANDPLRTGRYLVSSVHHKFILTVSTTILELLSDIMSVALPSPITNSPALQKIIKA